MRIVAFCLLAAPSFAEPRFEPVAMPSEHIYAGGWEHFVGGGVAVFDCDGDQKPEVVAAGGENPMSFFRNTTQGEEIRFEDGQFPEIRGATGVYPLDIDNDRISDLIILRVGPNMVLKGDGQCGFIDVAADLGLSFADKWTTAFSATWELGATYPTLAFGNYVDRSDPEGPFEACDENELWRASDKLKYKKTDLQSGFCALSMLFSDWNRSGVADLRISNDRHYYVRGGSEQMWAMPDLTLRDGDGWDPISIWGMGIASQDINGDGRPEVVLTSMGDQLMQIAGETGYSAAPFSIGTFAQRPYVGDDGRPSTGWHAQFGDIDNDARSDLFIAKGNVDQMPGNAMKDPNNLLMQNADGTFSEAGGIAGIGTVHRSRGAALADLNADGRLDLVVVNRRANLEVYANKTPAQNWVTIELAQTGSNPFAVGAWVEVRTSSGSQTQERV
ncbi:MAG: VCBS repeat-containing protein, partial [Litoreibacter sp.]